MNPRFTVDAYINTPVPVVYEAVADPAQLSQYFATGGAKGHLERGATVYWDFLDAPGEFPVNIIEAIPGKTIVLRWGFAPGLGEGQTTVTFTFKELEGTRTHLRIHEEGWPNTEVALQASYKQCEGWTQFLCALKAYLEHGINLREGMYR